MRDILLGGPGFSWHGQALMYLLALSSVVAVAIIIDRLVYYWRCGVTFGEFTDKVIGMVRRGKMVDAISLCERSARAPLGRVMKAGILSHDRDREEILDAMTQVRREVALDLERYLPVFSTLGYAAPLIGLLGTVAGLMEVFRIVQAQSMLISPSDLAGGVGEALLTTATGLVVAIMVLVFHNYFVSRIERFVQQMESSSAELARELGRRGA